MEHKVTEVLKILQNAGFTENRIRGSHRRFKDSHGHYVSVAYDKPGKTIPIKTYNSILRQADIK